MSELLDMSGAFEIEARAKTNLWLKVLGKREDGFHEIETRMVQLTLADQLRLKWRQDDSLELRCSDSSLPTDEENLCLKAVRAMEKHCGKVFALSIDLEKKIPSGAGLGGGSSDAAAVIKAINEMAGLNLEPAELAEVGATIGSDIPFFLYQGACDCRGRGEIVEPVKEDVTSEALMMIKPPFGISAGWAYQRFIDSGEYEGFSYEAQESSWGQMVNHLERPVFEKFPVLGGMKVWLKQQSGVKAALLSGSGSTMLAVVGTEEEAESLARDASARYGENCWTWSGRTV